MAIRPPVAVRWPLSSAPGATPQESAGRLVNCYGEPLGDTGPAKAVWRRSPGLTAFATTGFVGYRGSILVNNLAFVALKDKVITVDDTGAVTVVGTLAGTKRVTWARNVLSPTPQIQCVDPDNGAFDVTTGAVNAFNAGGILPQPNSVFYQDGYFFWTIADGRVFASEINSETVNALTFEAIQSHAQDTLIRGIGYKGLAFFFKTKSCEIWNDTANAAPGFPYSRLSVIDRGLLGASAIAGWEDGFGKVLWVADDFGVYMFGSDNPGLYQSAYGLQPQKVSSPDVDRDIRAVTDPSTLEASCYVHAGHSFWSLSSPTWTWEINLNTQKWNERLSFNAGQYSRWRSTGSLNAFGRWLTGDAQTGNLVFIDDTNYSELGLPMLMRMESGPVVDFPNRMRVARADFDFVTGVGMSAGTTANQTDPACAISWSRDDGVTWGNPLIRALGRQANSQRRINVMPNVLAGPQGMRWRFDITDPVYAAFMGSTMSANPRAN
jgi:hypothetical protein